MEQMSQSEVVQSVGGGWLGEYRYTKNQGNPVRWEGTFRERGGEFNGQILDDNYMGEAIVQGVQVALTVRFTKTYIEVPRGYVSAPIEYEGQMSADGKKMSGTWTLQIAPRRTRRSHTMQGTWDANRLWNDLQDTVETRDEEGLNETRRVRIRERELVPSR